jgi:hypothetical protein
MNDWIKQVDILAKGNEAGPVFDRIANGVFFAMVLRLIPPVNQKATTSSPPPPRHSAIDQGLILHARNRRSRHYNWTRVVFPMLHSKNIDLAPTLKRQLVEAEPEALQKLLYKVQQRIPLTDMPTQVQSKPHPQPQPQQRVQKTQHKNNLHMSPTFHQERSQHLEHEPTYNVVFCTDPPLPTQHYTTHLLPFVCLHIHNFIVSVQYHSNIHHHGQAVSSRF